MKSVLIASEKSEVYRKIHAALNSGCFIDKTTEVNGVVKALGEKRLRCKKGCVFHKNDSG